MKKLIPIMFCVLLTACGGSGRGNGGNVDPTGIWIGSFTETGGGQTDVFGFIFRSQVHLIADGDASGLIYQGIVAASGQNLHAATDNRIADEGMGSPIVSSYEISANLRTVAGIRNIRGSYTSDDGTRGTITLTYDPITDRGSSLELIADNWGIVNTGSGGLGLSIDDNGTISGSDSASCIYNGVATVIDPAINIYDIELNIASCTEASNNGDHAGFAFIDDRGTNRRLILSVIKID